MNKSIAILAIGITSIISLRTANAQFANNTVGVNTFLDQDTRVILSGNLNPFTGHLWLGTFDANADFANDSLSVLAGKFNFWNRSGQIVDDGDELGNNLFTDGTAIVVTNGFFADQNNFTMQINETVYANSYANKAIYAWFTDRSANSPGGQPNDSLIVANLAASTIYSIFQTDKSFLDASNFPFPALPQAVEINALGSSTGPEVLVRDGGVSLTVIPEPSVGLLALVGIAGMAMRRQRRAVQA